MITDAVAWAIKKLLRAIRWALGNVVDSDRLPTRTRYTAALLVRQVGHLANTVRYLAQVRYLPDLPPNIDPIALIGIGGFRVGMPLDPPLMRDVRRRFVEAGYDVDEYKISNAGHAWQTTAKLLRDDRSSIWVELTGFQHKEGSTCKIQSISEETVTKKVYEVVCDDGSEERVFA